MADSVEANCDSCSVVKMIDPDERPDCPSSFCDDGTLVPKEVDQ